MKTDLNAEFLATDAGQRADEILRSCVHCGFCNATCPTYLLTGNELDGPRGRIYLMRELLQGEEDAQRVTHHLDRCLTCRACETTCPSGVMYSELTEISRARLGADRGGWSGFLRRMLLRLVPNTRLLRPLMRLGRIFKPLLPGHLGAHLPDKIGQAVQENTGFARRVVLLNGCVQQVSTAQTNLHLSELLATHGIGTLVAEEEGCCGSLELHYGEEDAALARMRRNVDALYPLIEQSDAIISSATGCGATLKDYGRLLAHDASYAEPARAVSEHVLDVAEYLTRLAAEGTVFEAARSEQKVAWHPPCTLTHAQRLGGHVEALLDAAGYQRVHVENAHLCCGSAGSYSILNPDMAGQLKRAKLEALQRGEPELIATANVGCQSYLMADAQVELVHWIELLK